MLIAINIVAVVAAIIAIFYPDSINNFLSYHSDGVIINALARTSETPSSEPSWLLGSIMNAVCAILYIIFIKPLL